MIILIDTINNECIHKFKHLFIKQFKNKQINSFQYAGNGMLIPIFKLSKEEIITKTKDKFRGFLNVNKINKNVFFPYEDILKIYNDESKYETINDMYEYFKTNKFAYYIFNYFFRIMFF